MALCENFVLASVVIRREQLRDRERIIYVTLPISVALRGLLQEEED